MPSLRPSCALLPVDNLFLFLYDDEGIWGSPRFPVPCFSFASDEVDKLAYQLYQGGGQQKFVPKTWFLLAFLLASAFRLALFLVLCHLLTSFLYVYVIIINA